MTASVRRHTLALALALPLVLGGVLRAQVDEPMKPKSKYRVGVCIDWKGGLPPNARRSLARSLVQRLRSEDAVEDVGLLNCSVETYGPWSGPGLEKDIICYAQITVPRRANRFAILMRFYYVRGDYNIILPDITDSGYGTTKLKRLFGRMFHENFPVEAIILRKSRKRVILNRGSDFSVGKRDYFTLLTKTTKWWDVFDQLSYQVSSCQEDSSVLTIPKEVDASRMEAYLDRIRTLQPGQMVIRRSGPEKGIYPTITNAYRIIWSGDNSPAYGARLMYAVGQKADVQHWRQGPQMLRRAVELPLPAGVPVFVKAVLRRGLKRIEGDPRFVERWEKRDVPTVLSLEPQQDTVKLKVIPENVTAYIHVKVDGRNVKERPIKLRWGTHRIQVRVSADERWFPWEKTVSVPVPGGELVVRLEQDYKEMALDQIRKYYSLRTKATAEEEGALEEDVADPTTLLLDIVSIMEQCPPSHPQYLRLRYTVSAVLTREGAYPEALLAMLNYRSGAGVAGRTGRDIHLVAGGNWAAQNAILPRRWAWDWFNRNSGAALDQLEIPSQLKLPSRAMGSKLSAEGMGKIYHYILGLLFYHYAHGSKSNQPYLGDPLDRCLCYLIAYHYLSQTNYPTLADQPFLNATLNLYSRYYIFRLLSETSPLIGKLSTKLSTVKDAYDKLRKKISQTQNPTILNRLRNQYGRVVFHMKLVEYHGHLRDRRAIVAKDFLRYAGRLEKSDAFEQADASARKNVQAMVKEVSKYEFDSGRVR